MITRKYCRCTSSLGYQKYKIGKIKFRGYTELKKKQIIMITYLAELAYDIAISARDNVSDSPGFETCLGIF